jgi:hypothetical protein
MTNIINYPPQIEKKLASFALETGSVVKINIPYILLSLSSTNFTELSKSASEYNNCLNASCSLSIPKTIM